MDTPDALALDRTVGDIASQLGRLGDRDTLDVRHARAAGLLADPQQALDLLAGETTDLERARGGAGPVDLFVHVTPADLAADDGPGAATVERLGAVTMNIFGDWVRRITGRGGTVRIRPVLTVRAESGRPTRAVDAHDPPASMRERAMLRDATCVFPGCRRDSRRADLDHIEPYVPLEQGGPPGQTNLEDLAPLCRTHHRAKTHTDWDYRRQPDGSYAWSSPTGRTYVSRPPSRTPPARPGRHAITLPTQRHPTALS